LTNHEEVMSDTDSSAANIELVPADFVLCARLGNQMTIECICFLRPVKLQNRTFWSCCFHLFTGMLCLWVGTIKTS